jgi:Copper amine oxidase, enzyme domain
MALFGDYHLATGANWSVYWRISKVSGGGLEVWWADYRGRRVLWRGTQPFAIVPYHRPVVEPPAPEHTYKDGLNPQCGGAPFTALRHTAPNSLQPWLTPGPYVAPVDTDAVQVTVEPGDDFGPAVLRIVAKFQCGWYQYVHRWEFDSEGTIHAALGMGGGLNPYAKDKAHVHHMYFRIDLDIDGFGTDVFEVFDHNSFVDPGGDGWQTMSKQGRFVANPPTARKFRVRDLTSASPLGARRGYEVELPQNTGLDQYSTGDVWATVYRGDAVQQGADVGADCTDRVLENVYAQGPLDTTNGSDIVLWVAIRHHHEPRFDGEEAEYLPYHYEEFHLVPRGFEVLRVRDQGLDHG